MTYRHPDADAEAERSRDELDRLTEVKRLARRERRQEWRSTFWRRRRSDRIYPFDILVLALGCAWTFLPVMLGASGLVLVLSTVAIGTLVTVTFASIFAHK